MLTKRNGNTSPQLVDMGSKIFLYRKQADSLLTTRNLNAIFFICLQLLNLISKFPVGFILNKESNFDYISILNFARTRSLYLLSSDSSYFAIRGNISWNNWGVYFKSCIFTFMWNFENLIKTLKISLDTWYKTNFFNFSSVREKEKHYTVRVPAENFT